MSTDMEFDGIPVPYAKQLDYNEFESGVVDGYYGKTDLIALWVYADKLEKSVEEKNEEVLRLQKKLFGSQIT